MIIECGGVGYAVRVSATTHAMLPDLGAEAVLHIFTSASENQLSLYGFCLQSERELFDLLIKVKDVGPSKAIDILSAVSTPETLVQLLAAGDSSALTKIRGIGPKTADRLVVELRNRCELLLAKWHASGKFVGTPNRAPSKGARDPRLQDVASALVNMSFRQSIVDEVVSRLHVAERATVEGLLRDALKELREAPR